MSIETFFGNVSTEVEYEERIASVLAMDNATHEQVRVSFPNQDDVDACERMRLHLDIAKSHVLQYEGERGRRLTWVECLAVLKYFGYEEEVE